jgi:TetR/AcrR family transcriptional regulator, transcriptional repressor for nem operon
VTDLDGRPRLTARGAATRARIVAAAADLMHVQGVAATSLDQVTAATATSKSQLYQHFADKDALVRAVIAYRAAWVMEAQRPRLERLNSLRGLERWRDAMVQGRVLRSGAYGCPLGSLVSELADSAETVRAELAAGFAAWEELFAAGLRRMRASGVLRDDADPALLATALMAAVQGGYLLAQAAHDGAPMKISLDMALSYIRSFAP